MLVRTWVRMWISMDACGCLLLKRVCTAVFLVSFQLLYDESRLCRVRVHQHEPPTS